MATTTRGYTAVRIEYIDPRAEKLSFTAKKDITVEGVNGASVTIKAGERFYAVRAGSLGADTWYLVRQVPGVKKCSCISCKVCIHEKCVATGKPLAELKAETEAKAKERAKSRKAAKASQQEVKTSSQDVVSPVSEPAYTMSDAMLAMLAGKPVEPTPMKRDMLNAALTRNAGFKMLKVS